jgi:hypothetical protein
MWMTSTTNARLPVEPDNWEDYMDLEIGNQQMFYKCNKYFKANFIVLRDHEEQAIM